MITRMEGNDEPVLGRYTQSETTVGLRGPYRIHYFQPPNNSARPRPVTIVPDYLVGTMYTITPVSTETSENKNKATSENKALSSTAGGKRRNRHTRKRRSTRRQRSNRR